MRFTSHDHATRDYIARFSEHGRRYVLHARATLSRLGVQRPYLAVGGEAYRATRNGTRDMRYRAAEMCGCLHAEIAARVPALVPLIRWHLSDVDGVPMHYIPNALYHAARWLGLYRVFSTDVAYPKDGAYGAHDTPDDTLRAFNASIVFGAAPSDLRMGPDDALRNAKAAMLSVLDRFSIDGRDRTALMGTRILASIQKSAREAVRNALVPWLESRLPELRTVFRADCAAVGLDPDAAIAEHAAYVASVAKDETPTP